MPRAPGLRVSRQVARLETLIRRLTVTGTSEGWDGPNELLLTVGRR
jgi:hypothetical protein